MRKDIAHLITIESLVTLAGTLAGVFSIVYLVNTGFTIFQASQFYLIGFITASILCLIYAKRGFGRPKRWMALGMITVSLFYLSFVVLDGYWLLYIAPIFFGFYIVCFWVPFNVLMLRTTSREKRGESIGYFFLVFPIIGLASPIIGGYMIDALGYGFLFGCAFIALLSNAVLIIISPNTVSKPMKGNLTIKRMRPRLAAGFFFEGGQEGIWFTTIPLISMIFIEGESNLGYVFALFALAGGIASIIVARVSDRKGKRHKYVQAAALLSAPLVMAVSLAPDLAWFLILICGLYLVQPMIPILLFAMASDRMEKQKTSLSLSRELLLNTGRILGAVLCALVLFSTGDVRLAYAVSGFMLLGVALTR